MSHGLSNCTTYIACPDTDLLVQHIVALCAAEGMIRVDKSRAGMLQDLPAQECNTWRIAVHKGRTGWHAINASPWELFSEPHGQTLEPRLQSLCKRIGAQGFALEIGDGGPWGKVLMETDGDKLALSGYWMQSESAEGMVYHGHRMPEESAPDLRFQLLQGMQEFLENGLEASETCADTDEERACAFFAGELGGSTEDPWWEWACCDSFVMYFSQPVPVWPEPSRSDRELALHEFGKQHRHFYADGTPILPRDAVLFNGGLYPGRVIELLSQYDGQGSYFPSSVKVDGKIINEGPQGKTREFEDGPRFIDLVLVERNTKNFMRAGLKYLTDMSAQGDAQAQLNLGSLYKMGHGVKQDTAKALDLWRMSAAQGNEEAQKRLRAFS